MGESPLHNICILSMTDSQTQRGRICLFPQKGEIYTHTSDVIHRLHAHLPVPADSSAGPMYSGQCLYGTHWSGRGFLKIASTDGCRQERHYPPTGKLPTNTHIEVNAYSLKWSRKQKNRGLISNKLLLFSRINSS